MGAFERARPFIFPGETRMWIVMLDGPKKGEVQEMKFAVAKELILQNRARVHQWDREEPTQQEKKAVEVAAQAPPVAPAPVKDKKKKK
jgi:hypothetical protein